MKSDIVKNIAILVGFVGLIICSIIVKAYIATLVLIISGVVYFSISSKYL
ncbi:hypothetical protein [Clostridium sp. YIM B02506]|nr:hypothetical protein [Clostridium sp. YIM B02506]